MTAVTIPAGVVQWLTASPEQVQFRAMRLCAVGDKWIVELSELSAAETAPRASVAIDALFDGACDGALKRMEYA